MYLLVVFTRVLPFFTEASVEVRNVIILKYRFTEINELVVKCGKFCSSLFKEGGT